MEKQSFQQELTSLLNRHSMETISDTPDFALAIYLMGCLDAFQKAISLRDKFFGIDVFNRHKP